MNLLGRDHIYSQYLQNFVLLRYSTMTCPHKSFLSLKKSLNFRFLLRNLIATDNNIKIDRRLFHLDN